MTITVNAQINSSSFSELIGSDPSVEINLGPMMLSLLSSATENEDDISSVLSALQGISVTVYEINDITRIGAIKSEINKLSDAKINSGFEKLAMVKEEDSLVYIFAKMSEGKLTNLNIFALDDEDELVLIDIKGNILMSQIGELMNHFDVDLNISSLEIKKQSKN
jgi:hypothetical protein